VNYSTNNATRLDPSGGGDPSTWPRTYYPVGNVPYTYSDMTGLQFLLFTRPTGTWTVEYDSAYTNARWARVAWDAKTEPGVTSVSVRARSATVSGGPYSAWAGPDDTTPLDLTGLPIGRYLQIEVTLSTTDRTKTPVVRWVRAYWEY
jgi:hypothetical protein